jgi:hypothetical protein
MFLEWRGRAVINCAHYWNEAPRNAKAQETKLDR